MAEIMCPICRIPFDECDCPDIGEDIEANVVDAIRPREQRKPTDDGLTLADILQAALAAHRDREK